MNKSDIRIGREVKTNTGFSGVPEGTHGFIIEDYGTGITIGWDKPDRKYPRNLPPETIAQLPATDPQCPLRDGFDKETELQYLEVVS